MRITLILSAIFLLSCGSSPSLIGNWKGDLSVQGFNMTIVYKIKKDTDGNYVLTYDNVSQGQYNQPVDGLKYEDGILTFAVVSVGADYEGRLSEDGKKLIGKVNIQGSSIPVELSLQEQ
ncbi:MAG: hypothetical protein KDD94_05920 [Calditrichaeota bacterium]|nr:hypothetical protein [Calditrichota bacterium]